MGHTYAGTQVIPNHPRRAAFTNAHLAAAAALAKGSKDHVAAKQALRVYRKAVRANLRRLRRKRSK